MFAEGDYISHGSNGVCRVAGFTWMDVPGTGEKKEYYILKPVYDKSATVYSPVETGAVLKCRRIMTEAQARELLECIPKVEQLAASNAKELDDKCKLAVLSGECTEWVRAIKTICRERDRRLGQGKKMTALQERYLKTAQDKLCGELAVSLRSEKAKMEELLLERLAMELL